MFRGTTARTVVPILAAVLFALQFFAPTASFASAHTSSEAVAHARAGTTASGATAYDETVTCHEAGRPGGPTTAPRVRDRHRGTAAPQPDTPQRPLLRHATPGVPEPVVSGHGAEHRPRSATDHSPAALQVFRC
ncbi:hypothetical protein ACFUVV_05005 [Streptomyces sp. NPDC057376]|uniref:hypothetical protein n=1 Tax=unclassified Streptomyces TaxID=2593676 RepID=UPI00093A6922|nr:hypothetical protein [Streptomyces sp. CB02414]OKI76332.1 hypothetical protein AMK11_32925 [Streptomyces sp. CB02414]